MPVHSFGTSERSRASRSPDLALSHSGLVAAMTLSLSLARRFRSQQGRHNATIIGQAEVLAAFCGGFEFLGEADGSFDHRHRADGAIVVGAESSHKVLTEELALHEAALGADFEFVLQQLLQ